MLVFIVTLILNFLITAFLVGATAFLLFGQSDGNGRNKKAIVFIFVTTVFRDIMWYPVFFILDLDIVIGNPEIADFVGPTGLHDHLAFQLYDPVIWTIETLAAYIIGKLVFNKFARIRRNEVPSA